MPTINQINKAIDCGRSFLKSIQNEDGSWTYGFGRNNEPVEYFSKISLTGQAVNALSIVIEKEDLESVKKGLNAILKMDIMKTDPLQGLGYALLALYFSNSYAASEKIKKLKKYIKKRQGKDGNWKVFPSSDILVSFLLIHTLSIYGDNESAQKCLEYLKKNPAKDGLGWGLYPNDSKSYPSLTSNIVECLASCSEPFDSVYFKKCRVFLEKTQKKTGGWISSDYTEGKKATVYGTALATFALMLSSNNPLNRKVGAGIKYILDNQKKIGGWSLIQGGKEEIYTTFYVLRVLSFYRYLKQIRFDQIIPKQLITLDAYRNFESMYKKRFEKLLIQDFLVSRILGTTSRAVKRRLDILDIMNKNVVMTPAQVIDSLKKMPAYSQYNKRAHLTQTQLDLNYLSNLHLINKEGYKYYLVYSLLD